MNIDPALSSDGSLIAYASDRAGLGNLDIWLQPVGGGQPIRITSGAGDEVEPAFSPDSSVIVFSGGETGGIYRVGVFGGEQRLVASGVRTRTPHVSPDGRSILYWTGLTAWVVRPGLTVPGATAGLGSVGMDGGPPRTLAQEFASARYGLWSPDGGKILFLGERASDLGSSLDWYVIGASGGDVVRTGALDVLKSRGVNGVPIPGAWTAAGDVVFTTMDQASSNVWQIRVPPETGRVTDNPRRRHSGLPSNGVLQSATRVRSCSATWPRTSMPGE